MVELTPDQADRQKEVTLMHLTDIDRYNLFIIQWDLINCRLGRRRIDTCTIQGTCTIQDTCTNQDTCTIQGTCTIQDTCANQDTCKIQGTCTSTSILVYQH